MENGNSNGGKCLTNDIRTTVQNLRRKINNVQNSYRKINSDWLIAICLATTGSYYCHFTQKPNKILLHFIHNFSSFIFLQQVQLFFDTRQILLFQKNHQNAQTIFDLLH